jgi:hypothetical protein
MSLGSEVLTFIKDIISAIVWPLSFPTSGRQGINAHNDKQKHETSGNNL